MKNEENTKSNTKWKTYTKWKISKKNVVAESSDALLSEIKYTDTNTDTLAEKDITINRLKKKHNFIK